MVYQLLDALSWKLSPPMVDRHLLAYLVRGGLICIRGELLQERPSGLLFGDGVQYGSDFMV